MKSLKNKRDLLRMGGTFGKLLSHLWGQKEIRVLILGLDGAGKTTILYRMQVGEVITTVPSISAYFSCLIKLY